jgi:hypothetical protein
VLEDGLKDQIAVVFLRLLPSRFLHRA